MLYLAGTVGILLSVLLSGSIFALSFFRRRPEQILPITVMGIVAVLYVAGLLGILAPGFCFLLAMAALLIAVSVFRVLRRRQLRRFLADFFTPGMCIFCGLFVFLVYMNYGMLAHGWDEFSHWMDCVKAMTILDSFATDPRSYSTYASYPPSMSLFQYFVEKIYLILNPDAAFCEWLVYLAYQIFALSLLMPLLRGFSHEKPLENFALAAAVFLAPTLTYGDFYTSVYIDAFVGILTGCGFAAVMLHRKKDPVYFLYLSLLCFCLVLAKDAGLLFAVFVVLAFLLDWLMDRYRCRERIGPAGLFAGLSPVLALLFAKLSWSLELARQGVVKVFDQPIDFLAYTKMFFLHNGTAFRQTVVDLFQQQFSKVSMGFGFKFIETSYLVLSVAFGLMLVAALFAYKRREPERKWNRLAALMMLVLCTAVYIYGLGSIYAYRFTEREAYNLLSYSRYMNMAYEAAWILIVLLCLAYVQEYRQDSRKSNTAMALVLLVSLLVAPALYMGNYVTKDPVREASKFRQEYEAFGEAIHRVCDSDDKIYFIDQGSSGLSYYLTKYLARPNTITGHFSIGKPVYEGDEFTQEMTAGQFWQILVEEEYDYVAIYRRDCGFIEEFGCLFADPTQIQDDTIYRVNRERGQLEKAGCSEKEGNHA